MVAAGTRVVASVSGSWDYVKAPDSLASFVRDKLKRWGQVVNVAVDTGLLSLSYTATVTYITGQAHRTPEDIRATVAGVFESWNGKRPAVALVEPLGEKAAASAASAANPFAGFDPSKYSGLLWAVVALVVVVNVAPAFRSVRG